MNTYKITEDLTFTYGWITRTVVAPAGTPCDVATNLPGGGYWLIPPADWPEEARSWAEVYGMHVESEHVTCQW